MYKKIIVCLFVSVFSTFAFTSLSSVNSIKSMGIPVEFNSSGTLSGQHYSAWDLLGGATLMYIGPATSINSVTVAIPKDMNGQYGLIAMGCAFVPFLNADERGALLIKMATNSFNYSGYVKDFYVAVIEIGNRYQVTLNLKP